MRRRRRSIVVLGSALLLAGCASAAEAERSGAPSFRGGSSMVTSPSPRAASTSAPVATPTPPTREPIPAAARPFAWSDGEVVPEAFTFTVVTGISPRAALRILAPHPTVPIGRASVVRRRLDRLEARRAPGDYTHIVQLVSATRRGRYTLLLEDNDYTATTGSVAARLAAHGVATVLYTNVNALYTYLCARDGRLVRSFDPLLGQSNVGRTLLAERGLPFGHDDTIDSTNAMSLELTRRLTGYVTRPRDFDFTTYTLAMGKEPG